MARWQPLRALRLVRATSMEGYYGRLCALLALSIMLELPLREAGYGTLLFGLLIISVSYAGRHGASAKNLPGPGRGVPGGQLLDPEAERSAEATEI